uniref:Uncharacterized protein n=1 Tax=Rhizophora mucronata TaxID=61149 RepID=A0A2P2NEX1_RHIMU
MTNELESSLCDAYITRT